MDTNVNYLAILACGVASMVLGSLWYSKMLFGKSWMKLSGVTEKDIESSKKDMPKTYGAMFVGSLVMAYVLSMFINFSGAYDTVSGALVGFWAGLGFVATTMLSSVLFDRKPMNLYFINAGYQVVNLIVMGAILANFVA